MKNFIFGFLIGIAVLLAFLYFGGPKYMVAFGNKTEQAGKKLEHYEKPVQDTAKGAARSVDKAYDKTKEKVKEYIKK